MAAPMPRGVCCARQRPFRARDDMMMRLFLGLKPKAICRRPFGARGPAAIVGRGEAAQAYSLGFQPEERDAPPNIPPL